MASRSTDDDFAEQVAAIADLEALIGVRPTYFETMTASAFRWFADIAVDVAVIEVGLLGRWDATNVVEAQVAVVTNIGMDHNEFAGPTLADIALEKAGIIKPTSAAVIGETRPELLEIFAAAGAASLFARGEHFETLDNSLAVGGRLLELRTPTTIYPDIYLPLHGMHQGENAAVALTAVETFFASPLSTEVVEEAFANVVGPRSIRGDRGPTARDRRRGPQPAGRRQLRTSVLRRLPSGGPTDPGRRHPS